MLDYFYRQFVQDGIVVDVVSESAASDGFHPAFAIADQGVLECQADGVARADDGVQALVLEVVFHYLPSQFLGEFKGFDQALLLEL